MQDNHLDCTREPGETPALKREDHRSNYVLFHAFSLFFYSFLFGFVGLLVGRKLFLRLSP